MHPNPTSGHRVCSGSFRCSFGCRALIFVALCGRVPGLFERAFDSCGFRFFWDCYSEFRTCLSCRVFLHSFCGYWSRCSGMTLRVFVCRVWFSGFSCIRQSRSGPESCRCLIVCDRFLGFSCIRWALFLFRLARRELRTCAFGNLFFICFRASSGFFSRLDSSWVLFIRFWFLGFSCSRWTFFCSWAWSLDVVFIQNKLGKQGVIFIGFA